MQFIARFNLDPAPETIALCRQLSPEHLPKERLWEEWKKLILKGRHISKGLHFLRACGWLRHFPELEALVGCQQDEWHPERVMFGITPVTVWMPMPRNVSTTNGKTSSLAWPCSATTLRPGTSYF